MENRDKILKHYFKENSDPRVCTEVKILYGLLDDPQTFCAYFTFKPTSPHPRIFYLNYSKILSESKEKTEILLILESLRTKPEYFLSLLGATVHLILLKSSPLTSILPVSISIVKYDITTPLSQIRSAMISKFVCCTGNVIRVSQKKPQVLSMDFQCTKCLAQNTAIFPEGKFTVPKSCKNSECKNQLSFRTLRDSGVCVDKQRIKIQELSTEEHSGIPLTIECESKDNSLVSVGDPVTILGIVRTESADAKQTGLHGLYIEIISINTSKKTEFSQDTLTPEEVSYIKALSQTKNIFYILVHSFCPVIYGHGNIKAGLLLSLLGGNDTENRGTSHVLIVGDPGLGKTQLLRTAANYSNRGVYVSATTKTGLTVSFTKENGQHTMRAGALVMADEGVCAIDEFDKMGKEQTTLLEVMEQQTITIAKAGIYCMLRAKSTVLAAANPAGGQYNAGKSLAENLKVNSAVLSRFDLIFLLLSGDMSGVSEHVLNLHKRTNVVRGITRGIDSDEGPLENETFSSFIQRMNDNTILPPDIVKKYINYAQNYVKPVVTPQAVEVIKAFYIGLRGRTPFGSLAVTARQIHSLRRLTEARAKAELREEATVNDALEVIKLFQETILELQTKDFPQEKARNTVSGRPLSYQKQRALFIERLSESASALFTYSELLGLYKDLGLKGDFAVFIDKLNMETLLLKQPGNSYKLSSSFY